MSQNTSRTGTQILEKARRSQIYWEERAILDFTEDLLSIMKKKGLSKKELAKKLETAPAFVSKLLRGNNNYTLKTMVKVARALDARLKIHIRPDERIDWASVPAREVVARTALDVSKEYFEDCRYHFRAVRTSEPTTLLVSTGRGSSIYPIADPDDPVTVAA